MLVIRSRRTRDDAERCTHPNQSLLAIVDWLREMVFRGKSIVDAKNDSIELGREDLGNT